MPTKTSDPLHLLIQALSKVEKKNFKLYITRNSKRENLRTVALFDMLDKQVVYDEEKLIRRLDNMPRQQFLNTKSKLYQEILASLRLLRDENDINIRMNEQMDYAQILYNKGMYVQSLRMLEKVKEFARQYEQLNCLQQVIAFEKKIEGLHITRSIRGRAEQLSAEADEVTGKLTNISHLSNLSLQLYSWYISNGHVRDAADETNLRSFFEMQMTVKEEETEGFYERLFYHQAYCWFKFMLQDFFKYYRHVSYWVALFDQYPEMKNIEVAHYIKGLHNLSSAHFYLRNYRKLLSVIRDLEALEQMDAVQRNDNYKVNAFVYLYTAIINRHFMEGTFSDGLEWVSVIEDKLKKYYLYMDTHRALVFYYKIACLYFGSGDNDKAIEYLNRIINWKTDLRQDLQCYARLLHLIAHYELGNYDLLEYLSRSVYRMLARMGNLSVVEIEIFEFLKTELRSEKITGEQSLKDLLNRLQKHSDKRYETRAYAYLDITSWLESKLLHIPVQQVVQNKFRQMVKHK